MTSTYFCVSLHRPGYQIKELVDVKDLKTIGDIAVTLLNKHFGDEDLLISKIATSNSCTSNINDMMEVPSSANFQTIQEFGGKYIHIFVAKSRPVPAETSPSAPAAQSAFDVLMKASKKYDHLPHERTANNAVDRLHNAVIQKLRAMNIGFLISQVDNLGRRVVSTVTDICWLLDPHHDTLKSRGITLPKFFDNMEGFMEWEKQHKKKPMLLSPQLQDAIDRLSSLIMIPWMSNSQCVPFKDDLLMLLQGLKRYQTYLCNQNVRTKQNRDSTEPVRSLNDTWTFKTFEATNSTVKNQYKSLCASVPLEMYKPLCLSDTGIEPSDRFERRNWYENLSLPFPYSLYVYQHGNNLGNITWIWRVPEEKCDRNAEFDIDVINKLRLLIPIFSTRQMRRSLIYTFSKATKAKPAILRSLNRLLTNDASAPETTQEREVDQRTLEFLLNADDPDLVYDLRSNNGRLCDKELDEFWNELDRFLMEKSIVHERRHGESQYMPFVISVRDLLCQIKERLPPGTKCPSPSWLKMNFSPSDATKCTAMNYTGRFNVKYKVQQRLLRIKHADAGYAYHQFSLLKAMAVKYREFAEMIAIDDKAIIPVGEPDNPVSTGARPHHKALVPSEDSCILALDHDYHICGVVPSVLLKLEIPENPHDSFYSGSVHVTVKDKLLQASSPIRHTAENVSILRQDSVDGVNMDKQILFVYSDGGPDHRTTFNSVKVAALMMFVALDLDMYVAARTAPNQSYANPAERVMSLLNLALQHVSLSRNAMSDKNECIVKRQNSLKAVRSVANVNSDFKEALNESMEPVITSLKQRFGRLIWKETMVNTHDAASDTDMLDCVELIKTVYPHHETELPMPAELSQIAQVPGVQKFMEHHCRSRQYSFQIRKCEDLNCGYCMINPSRLPDDVKESLHWLPDPVFDDGQNGYKDFDQVYGTDTTDAARPSLLVKPELTDTDRKHKSLFTAARARHFIQCCECGKRRVIYCSRKLDRRELLLINRRQDELFYVCGDALFPPGPTEIVTKEGQNCHSAIETTYYAGISCSFEEICYHCGNTEIYSGPKIVDLKEKFSIVRPICALCLESGLEPATRNAFKLKKRKK